MPTKVTETYEKIAIELFAETLNDENILSIDYPDPPEALISMKDRSLVWVEVRSIYRHKELARNLNDPSLFGMLHSEPLGAEDNYIEKLSSGIKRGIEEKDRKKNYQEFTSKYGPGVLILYVDDPLCTANQYEKIVQDKRYSKIERKNFHSVYLYVRPVLEGPALSFTKGRLLLLSTDNKIVKKQEM